MLATLLRIPLEGWVMVLAIGAFVGGLSCALLTGYLRANSRVKEDTVMGIVFSGMFGLGLVIFTKVETDQHLLHILFGNVLGGIPSDSNNGNIHKKLFKHLKTS